VRVGVPVEEVWNSSHASAQEQPFSSTWRAAEDEEQQQDNVENGKGEEGREDKCITEKSVSRLSLLAGIFLIFNFSFN
jgi:hypothetical protein